MSSSRYVALGLHQMRSQKEGLVEYKNNAAMLARYFGNVTYEEFKDFWISLSEEEKDYYRLVDLDTGELHEY